MNIILKRYGFKPILITLKGEKKRKININFLKKFIKIKQINNYYTDINENDFDFLIVNSDQVWSYTFYYILEIGFLSFAKTWNITKFIYGASIGHDHWTNSTKIINSVKNLINQFSGISVREIKGGEIMNKYYGIKPLLVLDPTLLINKNDYLEIIKNFDKPIDKNQIYLCSYILDESEIKSLYIKNISNELNYKIINIKVGVKNFIEEFIFSINICRIIITDSYHGVLFSIIFKKPFLSFINDKRGNDRFFFLNKTFILNNRFIYPTRFEKIDFNILKKLDINKTNFLNLKKKSINFLKKKLRIIK